MKDHKMKPYLERIDRRTEGPRCDVTPLFGDREAFASLVGDLLAQIDGVAFDVVAGIDALGFILGTAIAVRTGKAFVPVRKGGKLPGAKISQEFVDYTGMPKALEMRPDALRPGAAVLLVDEWIETGAQVRAAARLIEQQGAKVAAIATINLDSNERTRPLQEKYRVFFVMNGS